MKVKIKITDLPEIDGVVRPAKQGFLLIDMGVYGTLYTRSEQMQALLRYLYLDKKPLPSNNEAAQDVKKQPAIVQKDSIFSELFKQ